MPALTADRANFRQRTTWRSFVGSVRAGVVIYFGALLAVDANGWIIPATDTAGLKVVGVAIESVDNATGANGAKTVQVLTGVFKFNNAGNAVTQASMHKDVFVADDNAVTTAAGAAADIKAGTLDAIDPDGVWVRVAPE
jgi:hypothetical protein